MAWYKTGTISVSTGFTTVTGTGTNFSANVRVGDGFNGPDGKWYEIVNIASSTVLGIFPAYAGANISGSSTWVIAPLQGYNKDSADKLRAITDSFPTQLDNKQPLNQNLTSLSSVVGAANRYLYFSNATTIAAGVLTDKARVLLALSTNAEIQNELGLKPVTSSQDVTAGSLLTVGYMGLGAKDNAPFVGTSLNPDNYTTGGVVLGQFVFPNGNQKTGYLIVMAGSANSICGQLFLNASDNSLLVRTKNASVWSGWSNITGNALEPVANINNVNPLLGSTDGFFSTPETTGDKPFKYGWVRTIKYSGSNYYQIAYEAVDVKGRQATRVFAGGGWQAWNTLYGTSNTTKASDGTLKGI